MSDVAQASQRGALARGMTKRRMQPGCRPAKTTTKYGANLAAKNYRVLLVNSMNAGRSSVYGTSFTTAAAAGRKPLSMNMNFTLAAAFTASGSPAETVLPGSNSLSQVILPLASYQAATT